MFKGTKKRVVIMYGASFLSIIIGFLVSIFNSRILGPEKFGDYKFIETVARFIASLVSVGFFISITRLVALKENRAKQQKFIGLFVTIFGVFSLVASIIIIIFSFIEPIFFQNNLGPTFRTYFFIVTAIIGHLSLTLLLKGLDKMYTLSLFGVLPFLTYLILAYIASKYMPLSLETILLFYYGILITVITIIIYKLKPDFNFKKDLVKDLIKENKTNGKPIYIGSLAGVATTHIAGLSISYFLNNTQVGYYMLALTICSPLLVVPSVLTTVYFKKFVNMLSIPKKVFIFSLTITGLALIVFYALIDYVILYFYTEDYMPVAKISKYLIIGFIFHGLGDMFNRFLGAKGEGKLLRNAAFYVGFINIIGYTLLIKYFNINGAIITKILASCIYLIIMFIYYTNFIKNTKNVQE